MKTVLVNRKAIHDAKGSMSLTSAKAKVYVVTHTYEDGRVRVTSGDVWRVKPNATEEADYIVDEAASS